MSLLKKFKLGLSKSSSALSDGMANIFQKRKIDENILQEFEDLLIGSDVGIEVAKSLKNDFEKFRIDKKLDDHKEILKLLAEKLSMDLLRYEKDLNNLGNNKSAIIVAEPTASDVCAKISVRHSAPTFTLFAQDKATCISPPVAVRLLGTPGACTLSDPTPDFTSSA